MYPAPLGEMRTGPCHRELPPLGHNVVLVPRTEALQGRGERRLGTSHDMTGQSGKPDTRSSKQIFINRLLLGGAVLKNMLFVSFYDDKNNPCSLQNVWKTHKNMNQ